MDQSNLNREIPKKSGRSRTEHYHNKLATNWGETWTATVDFSTESPSPSRCCQSEKVSCNTARALDPRSWRTFRASYGRRWTVLFRHHRRADFGLRTRASRLAFKKKSIAFYPFWIIPQKSFTDAVRSKISGSMDKIKLTDKFLNNVQKNLDGKNGISRAIEQSPGGAKKEHKIMKSWSPTSKKNHSTMNRVAFLTQIWTPNSGIGLNSAKGLKNGLMRESGYANGFCQKPRHFSATKKDRGLSHLKTQPNLLNVDALWCIW